MQDRLQNLQRSLNPSVQITFSVCMQKRLRSPCLYMQDRLQIAKLKSCRFSEYFCLQRSLITSGCLSDCRSKIAFRRSPAAGFWIRSQIQKIAFSQILAIQISFACSADTCKISFRRSRSPSDNIQIMQVLLLHAGFQKIQDSDRLPFRDRSDRLALTCKIAFKSLNSEDQDRLQILSIQIILHAGFQKIQESDRLKTQIAHIPISSRYPFALACLQIAARWSAD